ncbi:WxL domain-containing protein [Lacticaseibacillus sp. 53-4]|uniref:WxL domain-containing protein n=1 Tax=Lacticaseibacillus sp. 53-4 TaxID=2799575 RepID=UPI0019458749|nr:WxL domain-containing protein [Lacticaseibacillus sp. 53-4]
MKKTQLMTSLTALALIGAAALTPVDVFAADDGSSITATTSAEFEVTAGGPTEDGGHTGTPGSKNENLWLVKAPDLHFEDATIAKIIAGTDLAYVDGTVQNPTGDTAENNTLLKVSDLRGTGDGWVLTASIDQPTLVSDDTQKLDGILSLALGDVDKSNTATPDPVVADLNTDGTAAMVWTAAKDLGQGDNQASVDGATKFHINAKPDVKKGVYDATITWTLTSTPQP